ncbi:MAG: FAD-dependent oxidoreductase [Desulfobacterales bacterium]|nr:FAD-dependent oxidoreductase [Desulfobacterales bacterium]
MHNFETDVLVIGGGGGGAMAAYEASKHGVRVMMALKGRPNHCGNTMMAPGAIAGVGDWHVPEDSRDLHFQDTILGGSYLGEQNLVRIMVEESPDLIVELERIGALWQREEDGRTYSLRIDGGHTYARCPYLEDRTGREMMRALIGELRKRSVRILPNLMVLRLLKRGDRVVGAVGMNTETCETVLLRAKIVILACGGAGNLYLNTDNPTGMTGDGYAMALEAGAALMDMEFVQFYPLGFCFPHSLRGGLAGLLYYLHLVNSKGERFMEKYDPDRLELSTRDRVSRAMFTEVKEGHGGPHGGVFADMTFQEPGFIARMQPALYETYCKIGVDVEKDTLEVAPTCHFFMGGAQVDEDWQSTVPGLFIIGENAAGIQGANRLSQNALAELLVSGTRAGRAAAQRAAEGPQRPVDPIEARSVAERVERIRRRDKGIRSGVLRNRLRTLMWEEVGVFRSGPGLRSAQVELEEIKADLDSQCPALKSDRHNQELIEALENRFLVQTARCIIEGALRRTESRGAHYRDDCPETDNQNWLKHILLRQVDGELTFENMPVNLKELNPAEEGC